MNAEDLCGKVLGSCTLQKVIGRGGMGAVYLAQQTRPHRQVAVKVFMPIAQLQPGQHKAFLERFRRETDAAAALDHPNIVPVHEYGERDGLAYLVMPYISGGTLRDELETEGRLPLLRAVLYLEQIAAALDHAHERGVIHRDIKPANILMTPEKRLLLTDFGLVKIITDTVSISNNPLSESGAPMGTPDYMSPEQVIGKKIDHRADIYSLGVLLYHMVTGTTPFKGEPPMKIAVQHLHTLPPRPGLLRPDLPPAAEQVILRALAKRPQDRYDTAHDMASAFRLALEEAGVQMGDGLNGVINLTEEHNGNRKRGLFDPLWRTAHQAIIVPPRKDTGKQQKPDARGIPTLPAAARHKEKQELARAAQDIVAQNKMTSFAGVAAEIPSLVAQTGKVKGESALLPALSEYQSLFEKKPTAVEQPQHPLFSHERLPSAHERRPFRKPNIVRQSPVPETPPTVEQTGTSVPSTPPASLPEAQPYIRTDQQQLPPQTPHPASTDEEATSSTQQKADQPAAPVNAADGQAGAKPAGKRPFRPHISHKTSLRGLKATSQQATAEKEEKKGEEEASQNSTHATPESEQPQSQTIARTAIPQTEEPISPLPAVPVPEDPTRQPGITRVLPPVPTTTTHHLTSPLDDPNNPVGEYSGDTGMLRLSQAVKVVKIPIAGRPGEFKTGILPILASGQTGTLPSQTPPVEEPRTAKAFIKKARRNMPLTVTLLTLIILIVAGSVFMLTQNHGTPAVVPHRARGTATVNVAATTTAQVRATATFEASIIVSDDLASNGNGWLTGGSSSPDQTSKQFINNAYRMRGYGNTYFGAAVLAGSDQKLGANYNYALTLQDVGYNKDLDNGYYGMVIRYNQVDSSKGQHITFYLFRIYDLQQPKYQFVKVDSAQDSVHRFKVLFEKKPGKEFLGINKTNNITISAKGSTYTFLVNGKTVGKASDSEFKTGSAGMGVAGNGTDVAFTDLLLTSN